MKIKNVIAVLISLVLITGCSANSDSGNVPITLMLDYTPNTNHTGIYVADKLGYYDDVGIDLTIIQPSDVATESVVANNSAQFGISYGENVAMYDSESDDILSIYAILKTNTSGFLSRADRNITRPRDFEGKTYCGWGSSIETSLVDSLVKADGGDPSKVNIITAASNLTSDNDQCDFIWAYEGWDKINLEQQGIDVNYIPFSEYGVDWYTPVIITSKQYAEDNPEIVSNFIAATQKGYQYAIDNTEDSAKILLESAPELDEDLVNKSQEFLSGYYQTPDQDLGYQDPIIWDNFIKWLGENGIVTGLSSGDLYTNEYV